MLCLSAGGPLKSSRFLFLTLTKDDLADEADDDAGSGSFTNVPLLFGSV